MSDEEKPSFFDQMIKDMGPWPPWSPGWFYNKVGNCIFAVWKLPKDEGEYGEYVNNAITLYKDSKTGEVIGVMIKNVTQALEGKDPNDFHRGD